MAVISYSVLRAGLMVWQQQGTGQNPVKIDKHQNHQFLNVAAIVTFIVSLVLIAIAVGVSVATASSYVYDVYYYNYYYNILFQNNGIQIKHKVKQRKFRKDRTPDSSRSTGGTAALASPGDTRPAAEQAPRRHWMEERRKVNDSLHLIHVRVN